MFIEFCGRRFRYNWCKMRRYLKNKILIFLWALFLITICWLYFLGAFSFLTENSPNYSYCEPIDVVYTWVNGSDPEFIKTAKYYNPHYEISRYDDKNELRYSLRSLEKYAPWVRHVYIVTNGQIPNWLDLSYHKVTIVPHAYLATQNNILPTFSSAAIETFLHRIPKLSERFLYLNDDIFLNAPLYPEDLYTPSEGVRVYQAWMVPDCAVDCPWTYIADGACDAHCNIADCQFDGNDCVDAYRPTVELKMAKNIKSSFKEIVRQQNSTGFSDLQQIALNFNQQRLGKLPLSTTTAKPIVHRVHHNNSTHHDIYSQSLIHTNMLLNQVYGFKARNVLAHVGFLMQRSIIDAMQQKFKEAVNITSRHKFRAADDLQFAFVYYTFLMSETSQATVAEIFDEFDTDHSGTWSDREVRTLLARMYPLPLDWSAMHYFEQVMNNCSQTFASPTTNVVYATLVYERYEDSNLPTISKNLVENCDLLVEALKSNFGTRSKYKYNINARRNSHSNFIMLTSNITEVVDELDKLRVHAKKFNCINDNLDANYAENNALIRQLLEDFYLSFFPEPSKFELAAQYRNRFNNWYDYMTWRRRKRAAIAIGYTAAILLLAFLARCLCLHKAKIVRRCVQKFQIYQ